MKQLVGLGKVDQKLGDLKYKSENEDRFKTGTQLRKLDYTEEN